MWEVSNGIVLASEQSPVLLFRLKSALFMSCWEMHGRQEDSLIYISEVRFSFFFFPPSFILRLVKSITLRGTKNVNLIGSRLPVATSIAHWWLYWNSCPWEQEICSSIFREELVKSVMVSLRTVKLVSVQYHFCGVCMYVDQEIKFRPHLWVVLFKHNSSVYQLNISY